MQFTFIEIVAKSGRHATVNIEIVNMLVSKWSNHMQSNAGSHHSLQII